jgi:P-type E1-E2 ATPase
LTLTAAGVALRTAWSVHPTLDRLTPVLGPAGVVLAAIGAWISQLEPGHGWPGLVGAAVAAAAVTVRGWLDGRAWRPITDALRALQAPIPTTVHVPVEDSTNPMEVGSRAVDGSSVRTGQAILVREGQVVAVDGVVQAGGAWALLHPGARTPVWREPGDPLLAGSRIVEGVVRVLATRVGEDRALARPPRFGDPSAQGVSPVTRLARTITTWSLLLVGLVALGAIFLAGSMGFGAQLSAAGAVLLAAPLLALGRAGQTPMVAAAAAGGERGVVFQNPRVLDEAGQISIAALCTHGIVTEGDPEVVEVHPVDDEPIEPLLALAAAAESAAEGHPIARAIHRLAEARGVQPEGVRRATFLPGRGVTALAPGGEHLVLGNRQLLLDEGVSVAVADADAGQAESVGHTVLFVAVGGRVRAVLALQDHVRQGARAAVQRIFDRGVEVVLLSGDHRATVEALARNLDVAHLKADLLPEDRGAEVRRLRDTGGTVATVGRPDQDDAALAAADVPVVLGAAGSPAGERGIALATEDVRDAADALWIAWATRREAVRTLWGVVSAGLVLLGGAAALGFPGLAALFAVAVDALALPAGARLFRRIELRVPTRS